MTADVFRGTAIRTTDGRIALYNLHLHISGLERQRLAGDSSVPHGVELVDLLMLRGHIVGRIADMERAVDVAQHLARVFPTEGLALLTRARSRACLHRFAEALEDVDRAEELGVTGSELDAERAAILQAIGRIDEAYTICSAAVKQHRTFESVGAMAVLFAQVGSVDRAERYFEESRSRFRGVSPFGLAQLAFQEAHMWMAQRDFTRARNWLLEALYRVPAYAPAEGHLAEVDAELGDTDRAIARLRRLAGESDDPDYAAQLARILGETGRSGEAARLRASVAARYDLLLERHPAAFADHAAEFHLSIGGDPQRALRLAWLNAGIRGTPRAYVLVARAIESCTATAIPMLCE